jgi:hypothetical protein
MFYVQLLEQLNNKKKKLRHTNANMKDMQLDLIISKDKRIKRMNNLSEPKPY